MYTTLVCLAMLSLTLTACATSSASDRESWAVTGPPLGAEFPYDTGVCFGRTRVIGYSQVGNEKGGWFVQDGVFESIAGDDAWELQWYPGGAVDRWADPDYAGWSAPLVSACPGDAPPDRVVLVVGGGRSGDVEALADQIAAAVETIRAKIPSARRIVLQPVIGGPGGEACPGPDGETVGASFGYPLHVAAIAKLVERDRAARASGPDPAGPELVAGPAPTLQRCSGYADSIGHLKPAAARRIGRLIAEDYVRREAECARAGHLACGRK